MGTIKNYGILILLILLASVSMWLSIEHKIRVKAENDRDIQKQNVSNLLQGTKTSINKNGDTTKITGILQQKIDDLLKSDSVKSKIIADLNLKPKNIKSVSDGSVKGGSVEPVKFHTDTIYDTITKEKIVIKEILTSDTCIRQSLIEYKDKTTLKTSISIPIFTATHMEFTDNWKLKNLIWWRKKYPFISAYTSCKNITIEIHQTDVQ